MSVSSFSRSVANFFISCRISALDVLAFAGEFETACRGRTWRRDPRLVDQGLLKPLALLQHFGFFGWLQKSGEETFSSIWVS